MIAVGLLLSLALMGLGIIGIALNYRNVLLILMHIELMLLASNTNFIIFNQMHPEPLGHLFVFFILTCAAAETAIGLAIFIIIYRKKNSIDTEQYTDIKG